MVNRESFSPVEVAAQACARCRKHHTGFAIYVSNIGSVAMKDCMPKRKRFLARALTVLVFPVVFTSCIDMFGSLDNPVDPNSTSPNPFTTEDDPNLLEVENIIYDSTDSAFDVVLTRILEASQYDIIVDSQRNQTSGIVYQGSFTTNQIAIPIVGFPLSTVYFRARARADGATGAWSNEFSTAIPTHVVTYDANEATSGTVPADQTKIVGVDLTLATNTGNLARDGFTFVGWNTQADGSGTAHAEGATYTADVDVTLFATWEPFELEKIIASDGSSSDAFGFSVAISGDYAIVGARYNDDNGFDSGSAYIFRRTGANTWDRGTKILAPDGASRDYFGYSVAISGDYAIVGAFGDDDNGTSTGSAYIFRRTGGNIWDNGTKVLAPDGTSNDRFGISVAISSDYAIVGAQTDDDNGSDSGSAYIFRRTGASTWDSGTKILAPDGTGDDRFGYSVAISGDYAIVGAWLDDDNGSNSGSAYIFRRTGENAWDNGTKILAPDGAGGDLFGVSVAISGDSAMVGASGDDDNGSNSGSAYIFRRTGENAWDNGTKILASDGSSNDSFGRSVAISGDSAIAGAFRDDDNGSDSGSVYVFRRTGANTWDRGTKILAPDGARGHGFGSSVAVSGDYAILGAEWGDGNVVSAGSAYPFIVQ